MLNANNLIFKAITSKLFWIYFFAIVLLVTLPINSAGELNNITILYFRGDYFLHALMFVPWMLFCPAMKANLWLWLLYGLLFATGGEAIQYVIPYRAFNINDMVANVAGVVIGTVVFKIAQRQKGNKAQRWPIKS